MHADTPVSCLVIIIIIIYSVRVARGGLSHVRLDRFKYICIYIHIFVIIIIIIIIMITNVRGWLAGDCPAHHPKFDVTFYK